ncbi:MAG: hypothetical protein ACFCUX_10285 [Candidatus Methylacidiphilales bacterium]
MKPETEKSLNLANILLGIGLLLLIVPIGFTVITLATLDDRSALQAMSELGWICFISLSLIPIGLGAFVGGLTWMVYLKKRAKSEEIAEDAAQDVLENQ